MAFKNVVVAGGGVLGSQIAYQTAFRGFQTTIWLRSEESITRTQPKLDRLHSIYLAELNAAKSTLGNPNASYSRGLITDPQNLTIEKIDELIQKAEDAYKNLRLEVDMAKAVSDADLVIESMAENPQDKIAFYSKLADLLPAHTIVATNSSSMVPSAFRDYTKRPEKYLALHFANNIWRSNTAEIMGHDTTSPEAFEAVAEFAAQIAMVPLRLYKEQPGYILNSMLIPFLNSAEALWVNEVSDPETIDLTWKLGTGSPLGPFQILDIVGLTTAYNITSNNPLAKDPESLPGRVAAKLKEYIDAGKTGINAGEGFYKYK